MSRSGYFDGCENFELYRGNVERSIAGKKGQKFLKELAKFMDDMLEKKLITNKFIDEDGQCCTIGVFCKAKDIDVSKIDYDDGDAVGKSIGITGMMVREIEYENDEATQYRQQTESPEQRWTRMRKWVASSLRTENDISKK